MRVAGQQLLVATPVLIRWSLQEKRMARAWQASGWLLVANVGDSRAFLGRMDASGKATAVPLTSDHTPDVPAEAARILAHQAGALNLLCLWRCLRGVAQRSLEQWYIHSPACTPKQPQLHG